MVYYNNHLDNFDIQTKHTPWYLERFFLSSKFFLNINRNFNFCNPPYYYCSSSFYKVLDFNFANLKNMYIQKYNNQLIIYLHWVIYLSLFYFPLSEMSNSELQNKSEANCCFFSLQSKCLHADNNYNTEISWKLYL